MDRVSRCGCVLAASLLFAGQVLAQRERDPSTGLWIQCVGNCGNSSATPYYTDFRIQDLFRRFRGDGPQVRAARLNNQANATKDVDAALRLYRQAHALWREDPTIRINLMFGILQVAGRRFQGRDPKDLVVLDQVARMLDEVVGLDNDATSAKADHAQLMQYVAHGRELVAQARAEIDRAARSARELVRAEADVARISGALAENLRAPGDAATVDLAFGSGPSKAPALTEIPEITAPMASYANAQGWSPEEQARLRFALDHLDLADELVLPKSNNVTRTQAWEAIEAHESDPGLAAAAAKGHGDGLYSSGWQTGRYTDCGVFALATAAGLPYGVVAASANELLREAAWREPAQRSNPQSVFQSGGLMGGEVAMLAEKFGQVELVPFDRIGDRVRDGHAVLIGVLNPDNTVHQVLLSRTFDHAGARWFEMIDSSQASAGQRRYIREDELGVVVAENGLSFRPEPGRTPMLLRKSE